MTETERNSLAQLESTLAAYGHLLETEWYRALFDADEIAALSAFFAKVAHYVRRDVVLDVDDGALGDPEWRDGRTLAPQPTHCRRAHLAHRILISH